MKITEKVEYWLEGRYPTYKKKLSALIDEDKSKAILNEDDFLNEDNDFISNEIKRNGFELTETTH